MLHRIEPFSEAHLAEVVAIEKDSNTAAWSERSFAHEITNPNSIFRVALQQGKVVGYAGLWLVIDEAHITTVCVREDCRHQGIGWALVSHLLEEAKSAGMLCATLEVRKSNAPAIALYRRIGFESTCIRKRYYPDNHEDAMVMWLTNLAAWQEPSRPPSAAAS